ncbi:MAG: hypothetical protein GXY32_01925 [Ruminococcaceae bacterium]|nr:hypothetical protein [Oscillospiraceae bacterium]
MTFMEEYKSKLITAKQAAELIQPGMVIEYGAWAVMPAEFDAALAERVGTGQLKDLLIRNISTTRPSAAHIKNGDGDDLIFSSWYYSGWDRQQGAKHPRMPYFPALYHDVDNYYTQEQFKDKWADVFVIQCTPMDKHGFFNFGISNSANIDIAMNAKIVIMEVNTTVPTALGGFGEGLNIADVDYIFESTNQPIVATPPPGAASPAEQAIAKLIVEEIPNRATLQLGIGALPNAVGSLIAQSDLKDLGISTEMFCDAFVDLYQAGKITNRYKERDRYKSGYTFALGTKEMYDFIDHNANLASMPVYRLNDLEYVRSISNFISINNILEVDLYSQVTSEMANYRQISGTGGQLDFAQGAYESPGGKSFLAFTSTYTDKEGKMHSRIRPFLPQGAVVTTPRTMVHWLVTEYGKVNMKASSTWERAEKLVSIAHPDFREELIKDAEKMGIWKRSNKRD